MELLIRIQGLEEHRQRIYTVLTELYVNALEHGVLRLDSSLKNGAGGFVKYFRRREQALEAHYDWT